MPASLEDFQLGVRDPLVYRLADLDRRLRVVPGRRSAGGAAKFACPADYTGLPDGMPPSVAGRRWPVAVAGLDDDRGDKSLVDEVASFTEQVHLLVCLKAPVPRRQEDPPACHAPQVRVPGRPVEGHRPVADDGQAAAGRRAHHDYDTARLIAALPQIVELNIGHFLIGEAIFVGLAETIKTMRAAMEEGRAAAEGRR